MQSMVLLERSQSGSGMRILLKRLRISCPTGVAACGQDIVAELQQVLNTPKADHKDAGKPKQSPLSDQHTTAEVEKLRIQMEQLEKQLAQQRLPSQGRNQIDGLPVSKNGQKQAGVGWMDESGL